MYIVSLQRKSMELVYVRLPSRKHSPEVVNGCCMKTGQANNGDHEYVLIGSNKNCSVYAYALAVIAKLQVTTRCQVSCAPNNSYKCQFRYCMVLGLLNIFIQHYWQKLRNNLFLPISFQFILCFKDIINIKLKYCCSVGHLSNLPLQDLVQLK